MSKKPKVENPPPFLQILASSDGAVGAAFLLCLEKEAVLINAPEGVQRLLLELRIKLGKIRDVVFLDNSYASLGGMVGLVFALREQPVESGRVLVSSRAVDKFLQLSALATNHTQEVSRGVVVAKNQVLVRKAYSLEKTFADRTEVTLLKLARKRGRFRTDAAEALGVPVGSVRSKLSAGHPVFVEQLGRKVAPVEVMEKGQRGALLVFLAPADSASKDSVVAAVQNAVLWKQLFAEPDELACPEVLLYLIVLPGCVADLALLNPADPCVKTEVVDLNCTSFGPVLQLYLFENRKICRATNSVLFDSGTEAREVLKPLYFKDTLETDSPISYKPSSNADKKYVQQRLWKPNDSGVLSPFRKYSLCFLGTGCAIPNVFRTFSAILVRAESHTLLLDCGEATWTQFVLKFGREEALKVLDSVDLFFVSHAHADHFAGLFGLFLELASNKLRAKKRQLVAPPTVIEWLNGLCVFFGVPELLDDLGLEVTSNKTLTLQEGQRVWTFKADHPKQSYGVGVLLGEDPQLALYYSGDTTVHSKLKNSVARLQERKKAVPVVLVHESTFVRSMQEESEKRKHSTIEEALGVGSEVGAVVTFLTHFSGRDLVFQEEEFTKPHDFLEVSFADLGKHMNNILLV